MDDMVNGDGERTIRGIGAMMADQNSAGTGSDQSQQRNDDVFLNIARANSGRLTAAERAERRRVRLHISILMAIIIQAIDLDAFLQRNVIRLTPFYSRDYME